MPGERTWMRAWAGSSLKRRAFQGIVLIVCFAVAECMANGRQEMAQFLNDYCAVKTLGGSCALETISFVKLDLDLVLCRSAKLDHSEWRLMTGLQTVLIQGGMRKLPENKRRELLGLFRALQELPCLECLRVSKVCYDEGAPLDSKGSLQSSKPCIPETAVCGPRAGEEAEGNIVHWKRLSSLCVFSSGEEVVTDLFSTFAAAPRLSEIELCKSGLRSVGFLEKVSLPALHVLNLSDNDIQTMEKDTLNAFPSLQCLSIYFYLNVDICKGSPYRIAGDGLLEQAKRINVAELYSTPAGGEAPSKPGEA